MKVQTQQRSDPTTRQSPTGSRRKPRSDSQSSASKTVNRRSKDNGFWLLIALVAVLCMIGVVMVFSASSITSLTTFGSPWHYFIRQWIWLALGWTGLFVASRVHHSFWRRIAPVLMWMTVGLLFAVLVPGV